MDEKRLSELDTQIIRVESQKMAKEGQFMAFIAASQIEVALLEQQKRLELKDFMQKDAKTMREYILERFQAQNYKEKEQLMVENESYIRVVGRKEQEKGDESKSAVDEIFICRSEIIKAEDDIEELKAKLTKRESQREKLIAKKTEFEK